MDIRRYIAEAERTYHYRIKTVVPLDDAAMDRIERAIMKYQPLDISLPKKTMLQKHPLDFTQVQNAEVWIVDVETGLPASSYVMLQEIRNALNVPEKFVIVRGDNDPTEAESERLVAQAEMDAEAEKSGMSRASALETAEDYPEANEVDGTQFYGDAYNRRLRAYLKDVEQTRRPEKVDPKNPLFPWRDMPDRADQEPTQDDTNFNAYLKTEHNDEVPASDAGDSERISGAGNVDDDARTYRRVYRDATGKDKVLRRSPAPVRKED